MGGSQDPTFLTTDGRRMRGVRRAVPVANPGAGNDWSINVPGGVYWRLIGGSATFTASAAVANRTLAMQFVYNGFIVAVDSDSLVRVASTLSTAVYTVGSPAMVSGQVAGRMPVVMPPIWLESGTVIQSITVNLDAADAYTNINLYIEETFEDANLMTLAAEEIVALLGPGTPASLASLSRLPERAQLSERG